MKKYYIYNLLSQKNIEIWKSIEGYEGYYEVSNLGNVKSLGNYKGGKEIILKPTIRNKYLSVELYKEKNRKRFNIHRLVALHFLKKVEGKDIVNHIDCEKLNNKVYNLEWCTISENTQHAYDNGCELITEAMIKARKENIKVANASQFKKVMCVETGEVYDNLKKASKSVGLKGSSSIIRACKNPNKVAKGLHWKYVD